MLEFRGKVPRIAQDAFVAEGARLIGDVTIESKASVWFNAVLRGDINSIVVGEGSNVQDNCTVHVDHDFPVVIGKRVTIGHNAVIHGAVIDDGALIGMGAVLLNGARIGEKAIVAAGALVLEGREVPPRSLVAGVPAKVVRENLSDEQLASVAGNLETYLRLTAEYLGEGAR